jgi:hypothetical protein
MIENAWLMPRIYPGWECHCWIADDLDAFVYAKLNGLRVQFHSMDLGWRQRMFYRLLIHDVPGVERYLIRDADSRISMRERRCVDEWMRSDKILHTIHDHFYHQRPIQGGMFGIWNANVTWAMQPMVGSYASIDKWGKDEEFLANVVWPLVSHSVCEHGRSNPIQSAGEDEDMHAFIGEIYNADGTPAHPEHRLMGK